MSTEQKPPQPSPATPHHKEHYETTALGTSLVSGWEKFKQGKLISYRTMGLILIIGTAIGVTAYILMEKSRIAPKLWMELESANSLSALQEFAEKNPNTTVGLAAEMDRARVLLGPEGIDKLMTSRDEAERKRAVENIEKARELMSGLIDKLKDEPILRLECTLGMAKSEAALIGVPKEGAAPTDYRGSMDKLIQWLDKLAAEAEGTPWGEDAKKLSDSLKSGPKAKEELTEVQRSLYESLRFSGLGGLPDNHPFGSGLGGLPSLSGIPGGGGPLPPSLAPPTTPPVTPGPGPVPPTTPPSTTPTPKTPEKGVEPKTPEKGVTPKAPEKGAEPKPPEKGPEPKPPEKPKQ